MALNAGDLVFVGWDSDNENIAFLTTATIKAGEVIYFTDSEWDGTSFAPGEQVIEWTVTEDIPAGELITIDMTPRSQGGPDADIVSGSSPGGTPVGTVDYLQGGGQLAQQNEQFWAVQGTYNGNSVTPDPDGFVSMISHEAVGDPGGPVLTNTGLDATNGAVTIDGDEDFMFFDPAKAFPGRTYTDPPEVLRDKLLELIGDSNNWTTADGAGNQNPGGGFTFDTGGSGGAPIPLAAGQGVTTLFFTGDRVAFVSAIDDTGTATQFTTSYTFLSTDIIEIDIVSGDIQSGALEGEFDFSQVVFTAVRVTRNGVTYDLLVDGGSKIKETGGPNSGAKEQGDSFFTTNDDVTLPSSLDPGQFSGTLAFSIDETFPPVGNTVTIERSRPDLDTNGDGSPDGGTPFNNTNFNVGTALAPPPIPCFVRGSMIATPDGPRPVEDIEVGDLVETLDNGPQPVRWIGRITVPAKGKFAPIVITKGALGNDADLRVSPQHRVLVSGWQAELLFGMEECLVAAKHLCNGDMIFRDTSAEGVEYFHLLFDRHEFLLSAGIWSESFFLDPERIEAGAGPVEHELRELFPDRFAGSAGMTLARPSLRAFEGQLVSAKAVKAAY